MEATVRACLGPTAADPTGRAYDSLLSHFPGFTCHLQHALQMERVGQVAAWGQVRAGQIQGLERLFHAFHGPLLRFVNRIVRDELTAEEVVQDVFVKLWQMGPQLPPEAFPKAYLFRTAYRQAIDILRRRKRELPFEVDESTDIGDPITPEDLLHAAELRQTMSQLLATLPPACAQVFTLVRLEGMSYQEAADVLGIHVKTVDNQMGKALKLLRLAAMDAAAKGQLSLSWVASLLMFA